MNSHSTGARLAGALDRRLPHRLRLRRLQAVYWSTILLQARLPAMRGSYVVAGWIGSGTNWACNMMADYFSLPVFEAWHRLTPSLAPHIFHLHRFVEAPAARARTVYVHRDGRDAVISAYFKALTAPEERRPREAFEAWLGAPMDGARVREQMPDFLRWFIATPQPGAIAWPDHVRRGLDNGFARLSFEGMKRAPEKALGPVLEQLSGQPLDAARLQAAIDAQDFTRKRTAENAHFMRKGQTGEWRDVFTLAAREIFADWAGAELIALGYETNDDWITEDGGED